VPRRLGTLFTLCSAGTAALAVALVPASDAAAPAAAPRPVAAAAEAPAVPAVLAAKAKTKTPIKHVVVIFDENVSFDHYFGTYPKATNQGGTRFKAAKGTPKVDTLKSAKLLKSNPNLYKPFRLTPDQAVTCDQNHAYGAEQNAYDGGAMDQFVQQVSRDTCTGMFGAPGLTMGYFDGNTVTGLWNYAQRFAMSDSFFSTVFGPSTPGALNLVSGNTHGFVELDSVTGAQSNPPSTATLSGADASGVGTVNNDPQPYYDDCSAGNHSVPAKLVTSKGRNIGDLLNAKGVTWGWFQGGFAPTVPSVAGSYAQCGATHTNVGGGSSLDYIPHHNPFSYYQSTANPHHLPPSSIGAVGKSDQANHNYDLSVFSQALKAGSLPAVSFLKASAYQDGHAGYSDPIDEQHFLVSQINAIQKSKYWKDTAIVVAYDDSDGWYDHRAATLKAGSALPGLDAAMCAAVPAPAGQPGRCGPGPRLPLLVISPYARANHVDHHATEQASVLKFIEDNWGVGRIGDASADERAGSLKHLFDFKHRRTIKLLLKDSGAVKRLTGK
jgi:phospholipase C